MKKGFLLALICLLVSTASFAIGTISGPSTVCVGGTVTLTDSTTGGSWYSSNTSIATIGSSTGVVTGVAAGVVTITYYVSSLGMVTRSMTVNPLPAVITGTTSICVGTTTTLMDATPGGTWSSSNPTVATIGMATGVVTGNVAGSVTIYYVLPTGCARTTYVIVNNLPAAITGPSSVCVGSTITLADATLGGSWSSSSPGVATVGGSTGIVTGVAAGVAHITYTLTTGCIATTTVSVSTSAPAITGSSTVCVGSTITLADAATGGTWSSGNPSLATVGATSGIVTGIAAGVLNIYYTVGGCSTYKTVSVIATPAAITGTTSLCVGTTTTLADATGGGVWSSSNTSVATVGSGTGVVTGVAAGTATIYYFITSGCVAYTVVSVTAAPAAITGSSTVCVGSTITLSDATSGGSWSSGNPSLATVGATSGVVTGVAAGVLNIYYSIGSGCATYKTVSVVAMPAAITGSSSVCVGSTITLSDATSGGSWSSGNPSLATVGATSGVVTGVAAGVLNIYYSLGTGCATYKTVSVNAAPAAITGSHTVCIGSTTTLSDATTSGGWTWTSSNPSVATINATSGVVTGVSAGVTTITYTSGGCSVTFSVTSNAAPAAITGSHTVCVGATITLFDTTSGGSWSSGNPSLATVGATSGVVTGVAAGVLNIYYSVGGCGTYYTVTVTATTAAITGSSSVCVGSTITLSDATPGGTWSSSSSSTAAVGVGTGIVTGVAVGVANIYYLVPGCGGAYKIVSVTATPAAITGSNTACVGTTTTLADATSGGVWSSSSTSIATVGSTTGVVVAVAAGVVNITYSLTTGCSVYKSMTINVVPAAITGSSTVCVGSSITLADATAGGTWSSSSPGTAAISSAGVVTGISAGVANIYYLVGGCGTYKIITVTAALPAITGSSSVCVGSSITLSDATSGGVWSSSSPATATVGSGTGVVTGVSAGVVNITYATTSGGCSVYKSVSVNPAPALIAGSSYVCIGSTTTLTDAVAGGTWSSSSTALATVGATTGVVTGVSAGIVYIYYFIGSCGTYKKLNVTTCTGTLGGKAASGSGKGTSSGVAGVTIKLMDAATSSAIMQTTTDADGLYSFTSVADGDYFMYPEYAGYTTTPSATVTISGTANSITNINFTVNGGTMSITPDATIVNQLTGKDGIRIYPNPTSGNVNVSWDNLVMGNATVTITDVIGREVSRSIINNNTSTGEAQLRLSELKDGIYLMTIKSETVNYNSRISVRH